MKFKVGDKVKINKQATIEDLTKDYWNGCCDNTLRFLNKYGIYVKIFEVKYVNEDYLDLINIEDDTYNEYVNVNILKKIETPVKEMTIAEIEKELGYPIKVIKED